MEGFGDVPQQAFLKFISEIALMCTHSVSSETGGCVHECVACYSVKRGFYGGLRRTPASRRVCAGSNQFRQILGQILGGSLCGWVYLTLSTLYLTNPLSVVLYGLLNLLWLLLFLCLGMLSFHSKNVPSCFLFSASCFIFLASSRVFAVVT